MSRTISPQNIAAVVVPDDAVSVSSPGQLVVNLIPGGSAQSLAIGDGTGSPAITANKVGTGTAGIELQSAGVKRTTVQLDASENTVITAYDADGAALASITIDGTTGGITLSDGVTITTGGLTITAGGIVVTAGRSQLNLPSAADDAAAAALSPAVPVGGLYHTAGAVKQRLA
jgi:hypothetical protein